MDNTRSLKFEIGNFYKLIVASSILGVSVSYSYLYLVHLVILIFFITYILKIKENNFVLKIPKQPNSYHFFYFIMLFWYGISIIWAPNFLYALKYEFYILIGSFISLSIIYSCNTRSKLKKTMNVFISMFFIQIIIGLLESFSHFRLPISRYSKISPLFGKTLPEEDFFNISSFITSLKPPTGFHWDTNDFSLALLIALPFFIFSSNLFFKYFSVSSIIVIIAMSASRSVFFGLLTVLVVYIMLIKKKLVTVISSLTFLVLLILGIFQLKFSDNPRLNELANAFDVVISYLLGQISVDNSVGWRFELVKNGMNSFFDSYGMGVGAGGSQAIQEKLGGVDGRFTSMHNFWVEILVEGGIIFFIIFAAWYGSITFNLFKIGRGLDKEISVWATIIFLSMIGFIPACIAASSTIYFFPMWIMFGLAISIININNQLS